MEPRDGASGPGHDPPFEPVGVWRATDAEGKTFLITIRADGAASTDWGDGEVGAWRFAGDRLHVEYTDGWRDVIERRGDGWWKVAYAPGVPETGPPDNEGPAYRVDAP